MTIQYLLSAAREFKAGLINIESMDSAIADFKAEARQRKVRAPKYNAQINWCLVKMGIPPKKFYSSPRPKAQKDTEKDTDSGKADKKATTKKSK